MAKIINVGDFVYKVEYDKPHYFFYKKVKKKWWGYYWHRLYMTDNKTKFIQQVNRYLFS